MHKNGAGGQSQNGEEEDKEKPRLIAWLERMDNQYIRPFLIYKYDRKKKRFEFEFEDILKEYRMIEEELNVSSDEDEDLKGVPKELRDVTQHLVSQRFTSEVSYSHTGLLSQYIQQKMAKQVVSDFYQSSMRGSEMIQ